MTNIHKIKTYRFLFLPFINPSKCCQKSVDLKNHVIDLIPVSCWSPAGQVAPKNLKTELHGGGGTPIFLILCPFISVFWPLKAVENFPIQQNVRNGNNFSIKCVKTDFSIATVEKNRFFAISSKLKVLGYMVLYKSATNLIIANILLYRKSLYNLQKPKYKNQRGVNAK